jgi:biopolymer transport protein ExbB/TolQ
VAASIAPLVYALFGIATGIVNAFLAFRSESVDPSQQARVLAEGISEVMNCAALVGILLIPSSIALVLLKRKRQRAERAA